MTVAAVGIVLFGALVLSGAPAATSPATTRFGPDEVPLSIQVRQRAAEHPEVAETLATLADATEAGPARSGGEGGGRTLTVTPDTGLVHDQTVTLRGQGWAAHDELVALQCAPGPFAFVACEVLTDFEAPLPRAGPQGRFSTTETVEVILDTEAGPVDCRLETCRIGVGSDVTGTVRLVDVSFAPGGPDPTRYRVSASPDTGLVDGDVVSVSGRGFPRAFADFGVATVTPCRSPLTAPGDCDFGERQYVEVLADGSLRGTVVVGAVLALDGGPFDCRSGACALMVQPDDFFDEPGELSEAGLAPIAFDPGGALRPAPTLTVDPSTGLRDGDAVELHGAGFDPGRGFQVAQCRAGATSFQDCLGNPIYFGWSSDDEIRGHFGLRARFRDGNNHLVDCRVESCSIVIGHGDLGRHAEAVVAFDPDAPLLDPSITVSPSTGLRDGDVVTVSGTGWPDDGWVSSVEVLQCPADAFSSFDCFPAEEATAGPAGAVEAVPLPETADEAREAMAFETTLEVHTVLDLEFRGLVDCRTEGCIVLAEDFGGERSARAPLSFLADPGPISATPPFTG
jgi:hypothetical protein